MAAKYIPDIKTNFKPILKIQKEKSLKDNPNYSSIIWGKDSYGENRNIIVGDSNYLENCDYNIVLGNNNYITNVSSGLFIGNDLINRENINYKFILGNSNDETPNSIIEIANNGNILEVDKDTGSVNLPKITDEDIDNAPDTTLITKSYFKNNSKSTEEFNEIVYHGKIQEQYLSETEKITLINYQINKYDQYKINLLDTSNWKSGDTINILFEILGPKVTSISELIIRLPLNSFLNTNYQDMISLNNDPTQTFIKFGLMPSQDTINGPILNKTLTYDYFLNDTLKEFYNKAKANYVQNEAGAPNWFSVEIKFSIQNEIPDVLNIGLISIYIIEPAPLMIGTGIPLES